MHENCLLIPHIPLTSLMKNQSDWFFRKAVCIYLVYLFILLIQHCMVISFNYYVIWRFLYFFLGIFFVSLWMVRLLPSTYKTHWLMFFSVILLTRKIDTKTDLNSCYSLCAVGAHSRSEGTEFESQSRHRVKSMTLK